ncbi:MAG: hypothetical protein WDN76_03640 [Alphaproteobacteria bacterium]
MFSSSSSPDLKQLVARISLEDVAQDRVIVRAWYRAGRGEHARHLAAQQRNVIGRAIVRIGREEADEAGLANRNAISAIALDADVIRRGPSGGPAI